MKFTFYFLVLVSVVILSCNRANNKNINNDDDNGNNQAVGQLDPAFNNNGIVIINNALNPLGTTRKELRPLVKDPNSGQPERIYNRKNRKEKAVSLIPGVRVIEEVSLYAAAEDSQKRIIAVGDNGDRGAVDLVDLVLVRINNNGTLDTTFGGGDGLIEDDAKGDDVADHTRDMEIDSDGKIVVVGFGADDDDGTTVRDMIVRRFNDDGTRDNTFGGGDGLFVDVNTDSEGSAFEFDADGKIVVAGTIDDEAALWRLNSDGTLDTTFDGDGFVTLDAGTRANDVAIDGDGKIVICGDNFLDDDQGGVNNGDVNAFVARFNDDGTLDTTFDVDGIVNIDDVIEAAGQDILNAIAIDGAGKIVAAGHANNAGNEGDFQILVTRLNSDGSADDNFGTDSVVLVEFVVDEDHEGHDVIIDGNSILVTGRVSDNGATSAMLTARFNNNGTLDTTFSQDGIFVTQEPEEQEIVGNSLFIDSQARIVITGEFSGDPQGAVWRLR